MMLVSSINVLKEPQVAPAVKQKEETHHFAFHVAGKLKSMSRQWRILAEERINHVIFDTKMGQFQKPSSSRNRFNNVAEVASGPYLSALINNKLNLLGENSCL